MFRTVLLSIIRSFSLYTQQWYMSCRFADSLRAGSGRNWASPNVHNSFTSSMCVILSTSSKSMDILIFACDSDCICSHKTSHIISCCSSSGDENFCFVKFHIVVPWSDVMLSFKSLWMCHKPVDHNVNIRLNLYTPLMY